MTAAHIPTSEAGRPARRWLIAVLTGALLLSLSTPSKAHDYAPYDHTRFVAGCGHSYHYLQYGRDRSGARSYASVIAWEGYQWGGGCYNNNNVDDQPGDRTEDVTTNGEGPDCSGLVFRSWGMSKTTSSSSQNLYYADSYQHGPYVASTFRDGGGQVQRLGAKTYAATQNADALANGTHVGMIYTEGNSNNTDTIVESKSEAAGSGIWSRSYRGSSSYWASKFKNW